jgi:hypothetical protein
VIRPAVGAGKLKQHRSEETLLAARVAESTKALGTVRVA